MNLKETVHSLLENGYMMIVKGKYVVTAKFNKEMTGKEVGLIKLNNEPVVQEYEPLIIATPIDWPMRFMNFIVEAQVPTMGSGKDGTYDINKYSEPAMKAFKRMLEKDKVNYQLLVKSTMLYYKTHKQFQKTISNYIADGLWRTDYYALASAAAEGKEAIQSHIQKSIADGSEFSHWRSAHD
jgi:hypothetical protein